MRGTNEPSDDEVRGWSGQVKSEERREFQRLRLDQPVEARLDGQEVKLIEIGVLGARIRHGFPLQGKKTGLLTLPWRGKSIELDCVVVRTSPGAAAGQQESGLQFSRARGVSDELLRDMLSEKVRPVLEARRSEPGSIPITDIDADVTIRPRDAGYFCYRLEGGQWQKTRAFLPEQPSVGFTVAKHEDAREVERLCRAYQNADAEGRRLIRLFAELSVSEAMQLPPRE